MDKQPTYIMDQRLCTNIMYGLVFEVFVGFVINGRFCGGSVSDFIVPICTNRSEVFGGHFVSICIVYFKITVLGSYRQLDN